MNNNNEELCKESIKKALADKAGGMDITLLESVDSTNNYAKKLPVGGIKLVTAKMQTKGRGRLGREFFSSGGGIYMSLALPTDIAPEPNLCTIAAAVAVCRVIDKISDSTPGIKWVNDIFCDGKKVCGILCEGILTPDTTGLLAVIVGIGMNLYLDKKDFPEELRDIAGSVFPHSTSRNEIIAMLASEIIDILKEMTRKEIAEEYKSRLFILGMNVTYKKDNIEYSGIAEDINEYGNLIVNTGSEKVVLSSGEITLGSSAFSK